MTDPTTKADPLVGRVEDMAYQVAEAATIAGGGADDPYYQALGVWLQSKRDATRRSYFTAIRSFFQYTGRHPREVVPADVAGWKEHLRQKGNSDKTIDLRLTAVSSYYRHLQREDIHTKNPVTAAGRGDLEISAYEKARPLTPREFSAIMGQIDTETPKGARDYAMLLFYVLCGRRRSEVTQLRARDIRRDEERVLYLAHLKGGKKKWKALPPPVWQAIQHYWHVSGRTPTGADPIFIGHQWNASEDKPISGNSTAVAFHGYVEAAGMDPDEVSLHSLRHLGATLYHRAAGDVEKTRRFLDHARLNTTQIYLSQLEGDENEYWQDMIAGLGVSPSGEKKSR